MRCNVCGYEFVFDPKTVPRFTDGSVTKKLSTLSLNGAKHFTFNHFYCAIHHFWRKKKLQSNLLWLLSFSVFILVSSFLFFSDQELVVPSLYGIEYFIPVIIIAVFFYFLIIIPGKKVPYYEMTLAQKLEILLVRNRENKVHPASRFVDGLSMTSALHSSYFKSIEKEFHQYPPVGVLICNRDDLAECLIFNNFHFDSKLLIVSANAKPDNAYTAAKVYLENYPELPVFLLHDLSKATLKWADTLKKSPKWSIIATHPITDLGLSIESIQELTGYCWRSNHYPRKPAQKLIPKKIYENFERGYYVPLEQVPPTQLMSAIIYATQEQVSLARALSTQAADKGTVIIDSFG